jgi:hypothetical protein
MKKLLLLLLTSGLLGGGAWAGFEIPGKVKTMEEIEEVKKTAVEKKKAIAFVLSDKSTS